MKLISITLKNNGLCHCNLNWFLDELHTYSWNKYHKYMHILKGEVPA